MPCLSFPFTNLLGTHNPCHELWRWFWGVHVLWWPTGLSPSNDWVTGIPRARDAKRRKLLPGSHSQVEETDPKQHCNVINTLLKIWAGWCQITGVSSDFQKRWHELEPERKTSMNHSYWILTTTRHGTVGFVHFLSCKPHYSHTRSTIGHPLPTFS